MPGISGRKALIKVTGAPVAFTGEATVDTGDHQTYQMSTATKRIWDRATPLVVDVGGTPTGETYTFNRLTGTVRFATVNAGRGAVTLSGAYLPTAIAVGSTGYSYSITKQALVDTDLDSAFTNNGHNTYQPGMLDAEGSINGRLTVDMTLRDLLLAGAPVVIECFIDRAAAADLTMWALLDKDTLSAAMDAIQESAITFKGSGDDRGVMVAVAA